MILRESVKTLMLITKGSLFLVPLILVPAVLRGTRITNVREIFVPMVLRGMLTATVREIFVPMVLRGMPMATAHLQDA
jgi:hypothetical protein